MKVLFFFIACSFLFLVADANESTREKRRFLKKKASSKQSGSSSIGNRNDERSGKAKSSTKAKSKVTINGDAPGSRSKQSKSTKTVFKDVTSTSVRLERFSISLTASELNTKELTWTMEEYLLEAFADEYETVSSVYLVTELVVGSRRLQQTTNAEFFGRADFIGPSPNWSSVIQSQKSALDDVESIQDAIDENSKIGVQVTVNKVTINVPGVVIPTPTLKPSQTRAQPSQVPTPTIVPSTIADLQPSNTPSTLSEVPSVIPLTDGFPSPSSGPTTLGPSGASEFPVPAQPNTPQSDVPSTVPSFVPSSILPSSLPASVVPTSISSSRGFFFCHHLRALPCLFSPQAYRRREIRCWRSRTFRSLFLPMFLTLSHR